MGARGLVTIALLLALAGLSVHAQENGGEPGYFVEAEVDSATVYVGQQLTYSFMLYTTVALPQGEYQSPSFAGFWRSDKGPVSSQIVSLDGVYYTVTRLDTALFPVVTGTIAIEPARLVFPETVFRSMEVLLSQPITINVLPLPAGAPDGFAGVVGVFDIEATLDRQSAVVGEPMTLRLTVRGTGNVEQMSAPVLPVSGDWSVYPSRSAYRAGIEQAMLVGEKTFEWLITPRRPGTLNVPEMGLVFFDPETATYRAITTTPVPVVVAPVETSSAAAVEADITPERVEARSALRTVNWVNVTQQDSGTHWLLWLAPGMLAMVAIMRAYYDRRRHQMADMLRRSRAFDRAQRSLGDARRASPEVAGKAVVDAVTGYVSAKTGHKTAVLTRADMERLLLEKGITADLARNIVTCAALADEMRYSPSDDAAVGPLIDRTLAVLRVLDERLEAQL